MSVLLNVIFSTSPSCVTASGCMVRGFRGYRHPCELSAASDAAMLQVALVYIFPMRRASWFQSSGESWIIHKLSIQR
jgi:hypothetical protein